jgi:hypothetical protein
VADPLARGFGLAEFEHPAILAGLKRWAVQGAAALSCNVRAPAIQGGQLAASLSKR